jgi:hypothetical protein
MSAALVILLKPDLSLAHPADFPQVFFITILSPKTILLLLYKTSSMATS